MHDPGARHGGRCWIRIYVWSSTRQQVSIRKCQLFSIWPNRLTYKPINLWEMKMIRWDFQKMGRSNL
jgi:hypothetical protein